MTPIGYLGFRLASGETLLLPQGAAFDLVRPVNDSAPVQPLTATNGNIVPKMTFRTHRDDGTTPVLRAPRKAGGRAEKKTHTPKPAAAAGKPRNTARPSDEVLARNKRAVEAHGVKAASEELGVNYATLYGQAGRYGWKIPARSRQPTGKALEKAAAKEATGALRRCERCEQMTRSNPCQHCGHPWKREK
jgi:hypothetical protein